MDPPPLSLIDIFAVLLVVVVLMLVAVVSFILGRRTMADFTTLNANISALQTTTNQMGATSARAIAQLQSPDADQSQIDAAAARVADVEGQLAEINSQLAGALPQNPTVNPLARR